MKAKKHSDFKPESEKLEGPGQFLRHYSPNIESYLYLGEFASEGDHDFKLDHSVLIDYNGLLASQKDKVLHYIDMSPRGNYLEAINNVYDVLRWAETKVDAKTVLITHMMELDKKEGEEKEGAEHKDALFDRIYRATSGRVA